MNNLILNDFKNFQYIAKQYTIDINNHQSDQFKRYYEILLKWNKKINLISRKEENIFEKHFLDSILFLPEIDGLVNQAPTVFDIGSGGGFPGIPLAIMKPDWKFTLCESIKKKTGFLDHLVMELGLKNVEIINARVETLRATYLQKKFDFGTARAVGKLDLLIKYSLPLLKENGYLLAYKAKNIDEEIKNASKTIKKNKLKLEIFSKDVNGIERKLVVIKCSFSLIS